MNEIKYFISYVAYCNNIQNNKDFFNTTITSTEEINSDDILKLQNDLLKLLNDECKNQNNKIEYYSVQVLFFSKIN